MIVTPNENPNKMGFKKSLMFNNERRERLHKAVSIYLEKSSVSGVSFIIGTKYAVVRIIWTALLIIALIGMTIHLVALLSQYSKYQKQSSTDLHFSILPLPAVTFCNVNPIRMSQIHLASPVLTSLVTSFDPERIREIGRRVMPGRWNKTQHERSGDPGHRKPTTKSPSKHGAHGNDDDEDDDDNNDDDDTLDEEVDALFSNFDFDSFLVTNWNGDSQYDGDDDEDGSHERCTRPHCTEQKGQTRSKGTISSFRKINSVFRILYGAEPHKVRNRMGHRLKHMLINCDVAGAKCMSSHFQRTSSDLYGNCFTVEYDDLLVINDGPSSGLDLLLYLQGEEYLRGFTPSSGIQVVVHEPGTIPFPEDEGFSVAAGTHTMVGLKMQDISRLEAPHGDCSNVGDFKEKYGATYTRQTCQKLCQTSHIVAACGCMDLRGITLSRVINITDAIKPCRSDKERRCAQEMEHDLNKRGKRNCLCKNPCRQKKFVKTVSSHLWPNKDYAKVFVSHICGKGHAELEKECGALEKKQGEELRQEFLKLSIYYEDLNYEKLTELPSYKLVQLLCDVGGSIGLWIGLSLLSLCEILHLLGNILVSACCFGIKKQCNARDGADDKEEGEKGLSEIPMS